MIAVYHQQPGRQRKRGARPGRSYLAALLIFLAVQVGLLRAMLNGAREHSRHRCRRRHGRAVRHLAQVFVVAAYYRSLVTSRQRAAAEAKTTAAAATASGAQQPPPRRKYVSRREQERLLLVRVRSARAWQLSCRCQRALFAQGLRGQGWCLHAVTAYAAATCHRCPAAVQPPLPIFEHTVLPNLHAAKHQL